MVNETPNVPSSTVTTGAANAIKVARPDIIEFERPILPPEVLLDLLFQSIGGEEIISISRNDIIDGNNVAYNIIKNTDEVSLQYNPKNIFTLPGSSEALFSSFAIRLELYAKSDFGDEPYLNDDGDLIINVTYLNSDEAVEVQILNSGNVIGDTIYTGDES